LETAVIAAQQYLGSYVWFDPRSAEGGQPGREVQGHNIVETKTERKRTELSSIIFVFIFFYKSENRYRNSKNKYENRYR
jgi:hypothetical protein